MVILFYAKCEFHMNNKESVRKSVQPYIISGQSARAYPYIVQPSDIFLNFCIDQTACKFYCCYHEILNIIHSCKWRTAAFRSMLCYCWPHSYCYCNDGYEVCIRIDLLHLNYVERCRYGYGALVLDRTRTDIYIQFMLGYQF